MASSLEITVAAEQVQLLANRTLFWPRERTLIIADPHFGKSATFRFFGIAAPDETGSDLDRLDDSLAKTGAKRLVVLGDFLHSRAGRSKSVLEAMTAWRTRKSELEIILVRGNHDRGAGDPPDNWRIHCAGEPYRLGPFLCAHFPSENPEGYTLAGHIHPAVSLRERSGVSLQAACFVVGQHRAILPAFGSFTGAARIKDFAADRVFAVNGEVIIQVHGTLGAEARTPATTSPNHD